MTTYRVTYKGTIPGEEFNFGLHVTGAAAASAACQTAANNAITSAWTDAVDGWTQAYTNQVSIVAVHVAELDPVTGKQIDAADGSSALTGTTAGQMLPHEVAVAVATRGAAPTRKNRGRFYLPPPAVSVVSNARILAATRGHLAQGAAILINSLQAAAFNPVILHKDHTTTLITQVDVGDVFDVQRRRRNKLLEVRTTVGV